MSEHDRLLAEFLKDMEDYKLEELGERFERLVLVKMFWKTNVYCRNTGLSFCFLHGLFSRREAKGDLGLCSGYVKEACPVPLLIA